jgi:hypothetical protein
MSLLPEEIELHRDKSWRRDETLRIETVSDAERFVEEVGFCAAMTDARKEIPSLYIAVCGRREVQTPKNVQKDVECSAAWVLKDETLRRGRVYYGKITKGQSIFVASRLIPAFNALFGMPRSKENESLSTNAQTILQILRKEWESASADLRKDAGIADRKEFNKAMDELQNKLKVIPAEVLYEPKFTYIWTVPETRFPEQLKEKLDRETALTEVARAYLQGAGQTSSKELARIIGVTPLETNLGFLNLVEEEFAFQVDNGVFRLQSFND